MSVILYKLAVGVAVAGMLWFLHYLGNKNVPRRNENTRDEREAA